MKRMMVALALALAMVATPLAAQVSRITRTPARGSDRSGFSIGPRYSNYKTTTDIDIFTIDTGRQHSFGLVGEYRAGAFVLDFLYDHDPENGFQLTDLLPIELGNFSRDRGEVTIGWVAHDYIDLQAGLRVDSVSLGGRALGSDIFGGEDFDYSGLLGGIKVHTATNRPFGLYGLVRGYIGSVDFGQRGPKTDMSGRRFEGGVVIPIGDSSWKAVPGLEYEYFETDERGMAMETNRFFVNFVYTMPR